MNIPARPDVQGVRLVCPRCQSPDGLWAVATFEGWHSVDALLVEGRKRPQLKVARHGRPYCEITGNEAVELDDLEMGCSCGWEGGSNELVQLGTDGKPLPEVNSDQETLC